MSEYKHFRGIDLPPGVFDEYYQKNKSKLTEASVNFDDKFFRRIQFADKLPEFLGIDESQVKGRLMVLMKPGTSYHVHIDPNMYAMHMPIITNSGCKMIINNESFHMEVGKLCICETTEMHSAFNAGQENRYHIVWTIHAEDNFNSFLNGIPK